MIQSKILLSTCALLFFVMGATVGLLVNAWKGIVIKQEVDLSSLVMDLLTLVITVCLAYWVAEILEKNKETNRIEKDLIIKRVGDIYALIESCYEKVSKREIGYSEAASILKRITVSIKHIVNTVNGTTISLDNSQHGRISRQLSILKDLLTNSPSLTEKDLSIIPMHIKDGIIHLAESRALEIEGAFNDLKYDILALEIAINKG